MTKRQKEFYDYLQKLKAYDNPKFVETALREFFKYWEMYEKRGCKDSMTIAMESTEAFVGLPIVVHLNSEVEKEESTIESDGEIKEYTPVEISVDVIKEMIKIGTWKGSLEEEEIMYNLENNLYPENYTKELNKLLK